MRFCDDRQRSSRKSVDIPRRDRRVERRGTASSAFNRGKETDDALPSSRSGRTQRKLRRVREMRKHVGWYLKGVRGSAAFRGKVNQITDINVLIETIKDIQEE